MAFFGKVLNQQLVLLLLVLVGLIVKKLRILNRESEKAVSSLLVNVLLPCNIIQSFLGEITISAEFVKSCILAILIAACIQIVSVLPGNCCFTAFRKKSRRFSAMGSFAQTQALSVCRLQKRFMAASVCFILRSSKFPFALRCGPLAFRFSQT